MSSFYATESEIVIVKSADNKKDVGGWEGKVEEIRIAFGLFANTKRY